jgi:hypothetical protein
MTAIGPYARFSKNFVGVMSLPSVDQAARHNAGVALKSPASGGKSGFAFDRLN